MPSWPELLRELETAAGKGDDAATAWLSSRSTDALTAISRLRGGRNVLLYGSAFLQKQAPSPFLMITHEDLNGLMSAIYGMDYTKGLTLILHTPGGVPNAAESIVDYLRAKFPDFEVIVPALAMSAGTMIALAADRIVMGRQSQLGPIDPQMALGGRTVSARAIVEQFERGKEEILQNVVTAHAWAPILQSMGPALLVEAQNALDYGEKMVAQWLAKYQFSGEPDASERAKAVAAHFNDASRHKSHGRRISIEEVAGQGLRVDRLEDDQSLQEQVLTAYHLMTLGFEHSRTTKAMRAHTDLGWFKNWTDPNDVKHLGAPAAAAPGGDSRSAPPAGPNRADRRAQARRK